MALELGELDDLQARRALPRVAAGATLVLGTRVVGIAIRMATSVITARVLGPSGRGTLAIVLLVPAVLLMLCSGGLDIANVYFLGRRRFALEAMVSQSITFALLSSLAVLALMWIAFPMLHRSVLHGVEPSVLGLALATLPMLVITHYLSSVLLGIEDLKCYNLLVLGGGGFELATLSVALILYGGGLREAVWAILLAQVATALLALGLVGRRAKLRLGLNAIVVKASLAYGLKGQSGNIIQFLNYRLDTFLVNAWLGAEQVGYYTLAVSLAEMLRVVPDAIRTVLVPRMSSASREEADGLPGLMWRASLVPLSMLVVVLLVVSGPVIELLYGREFLPALGPLRILLPAVLILVSASGFTGYLTARGHVIYNTWGTVLALVATVTLDFALIPRWGIVGAASASLVSYMTTFAVAALCFQRVSGRRLARALRFTRSDLAVYREVVAQIKGGATR